MAFIYAVEGDEATGPSARDLLDFLRRNTGAAVNSELSLAEVLAPTKRRGKIPSRLRRAYLDLIVWGGWTDLEPVSRPILYETADLRPVAELKLPDAIHVVTAMRAGCGYFVTSDARIRVPPDTVIIEPNDAGVVRVQDAFA